ncbi:MAG TPA: tyrosine-protein phosphatase [Gaiellaceae bacterium]|nr:tyrosine-protein phosphatase [Gaiellaceae bacterium]
MPPEAVRHRRELAWDGCLNVRDLGGHPIKNGGQTQYGRIVRADSVRQLTEAGWKAAVEYGIHTVVDLRGDNELADDPPGDLPLDVVHVPFLEADAEDWDSIVAELESVRVESTDAAAQVRGAYLIFLEHFRANAAAGIRAVARAPEGGVVVHCLGGKDRTGLLCAFLLDLAGVGMAAIAADYALSEVRLQPRHEKWLADAETEEEREQLRRMLSSPAEAMIGVLEELERRYGGVRGFLRAGGLSEEDLGLAAERLR